MIDGQLSVLDRPILHRMRQKDERVGAFMHRAIGWFASSRFEGLVQHCISAVRSSKHEGWIASNLGDGQNAFPKFCLMILFMLRFTNPRELAACMIQA